MGRQSSVKPGCLCTRCAVTRDGRCWSASGRRASRTLRSRIATAGLASPEELYDRPVNVFVAGFIGSPAMNMLAATVEDGAIRLGETVVPADGLGAYKGRDVIVGVRPEDLEDAALVQEDGPRLRGRVEVRESLGSEVLVHFTVAARPAVTDETRELAADAGDDRVADADRPARLVGRFSPRTRVLEGDEIEVAVDTAALHFFDPRSGLAIRP